MASVQWSIMGWFTGCRPTRGLLLPPALTRSGAGVMSRTGLIKALCSSRKRSSPRHPRHLQPRRGNHLAHHFVDTAAERDDQVALGLAVEPLQQFGGRRFGRVAVLADDLLGKSP